MYLIYLFPVMKRIEKAALNLKKKYLNVIAIIVIKIIEC